LLNFCIKFVVVYLTIALSFLLCGFEWCWWWLVWVQDLLFVISSEGLHLKYAWEIECCACNCYTAKC